LLLTSSRQCLLLAWYLPCCKNLRVKAALGMRFKKSLGVKIWEAIVSQEESACILALTESKFCSSIMRKPEEDTDREPVISF